MTSLIAGSRLLIAVDVESYSKRLVSEHAQIQDDLNRLIIAAANQARLPYDDWIVQPQGDGQLIMVPIDDAEPRYIDEFMRHLDSGLNRHNRNLVPEAKLRLRVAMDHGPADVAANGFAGDPPITACRLRDSDVCREALAVTDAPLVLILSPGLYRDLVTAERTTHDVTEFVEVDIDELKVAMTGWLWRPRERKAESLSEARNRRNSRPAGAASFHQKADVINNVNDGVHHTGPGTLVFGTVVNGSGHE
ncbi:hypothetical protein AB0M46_15435 [Dactylosporangium sp. NPDC051485]|uniref:hypothetical protein n=1 Tax=Dactylosporangium sp. NPDC051485 TaxID=3154846 RepID=UPI00341C6FFA